MAYLLVMTFVPFPLASAYFYCTHRFLHWDPLYSRVHYLHHKYFERNYGGRLIPIDAWMGTWHDGTPEAHERMKARRRRRIANH